MSVTTGDLVTQIFTTANPATGAAADADSLPTGVLWLDGVANGATVTIADAAGTGKYTFAVTIPAVTQAQRVQVVVDATIGGVACNGEVWNDQAVPSANVTYWKGNVPDDLDVDGNVPTASSGLTAQEVTDAVINLAPTGTPAVGSIGYHLDDILEDTSTTLPALVSGLDGATVEVVSAVSGGTITVYVADTWRFTVLSDALSLDGYEKLGLVVKRGERATDNEALLYLRSDTGLARIKGAAPVSAANGSLTKTATSFTGEVAVAETQSVPTGQYQWWLKGFDTSPDPDEATTLAIGDFVVKAAGLQAVL